MASKVNTQAQVISIAGAVIIRTPDQKYVVLSPKLARNITAELAAMAGIAEAADNSLQELPVIPPKTDYVN